MSNIFDAAIINDTGIIENIIVFDNEETMKEFGALKLDAGQKIGDKYIAPEECENIRQKRILKEIIQTGILEV